LPNQRQSSRSTTVSRQQNTFSEVAENNINDDEEENGENDDETSQSNGYQTGFTRKSVPNIKLKIQTNRSDESDFKSIKNLLKPVSSKGVSNSSKRNR
jgi:hypothetical protein